MAFQNFSSGIQLLPHTGTPVASLGGSLEALTSDGKLYYFNASTSQSSPLALEATTVQNINGFSGIVNVLAGTNTTIVNSSNSITISSTGGSFSSLLIPPTVQSFGAGTGTYNKNYAFILETSVNVREGEQYTINSSTYTVYETLISTHTYAIMSGSSAPPSSGTLGLITGSGSPAVAYSSFIAPTYLQVEGVGAGGGGGGSSTSSTATDGGTGGNTTFGSALFLAQGGVGGTAATSVGIGNGGTGGGASATGINPITLSGQNGNGGIPSTAALGRGGNGGASFFGGAGVTTNQGTPTTGGAAQFGSGSGGAGAGATSGGGAGGGGAGGYFKQYVYNPTTTYTYTVGTLGSGGTGSSFAGGNGADGQIIVTEHYNC